MSLLNNMLNDLENRQSTAGAGQTTSPSMQLLPPARRTGVNTRLLVGVLIIATGGIGWLWVSHQKTAKNPPVLQVATPAEDRKNQTTPVKTVSSIAISAAMSSVQITTVSASTKSPLEKPDTEKSQNASVAPKNNLAKTNLVTKKDSPNASQTPQQTKVPLHPTERMPLKIVSPQQQSDNLYQQAIVLLQQSKITDAQHILEEALNLNPSNHNSRLLLVDLLFNNGDNARASTLLKKGIELTHGHSGFSMALARLQIARGAENDAVSTLEDGLPSAGDNAEYAALLAALLQKRGRHIEAIKYYVVALRSNPTMPNWLIGIGISLHAENKLAEADEAFQRAVDTGELSSEVEQFANKQLKQIHQQRSTAAQ